MAVATLCGCATGDRLLRLSPFDDSEPPDPDRVNLWPFWYADGARGAAAWPLFDWDDHGFAARPFVCRDDDDLDLLWPLAHVDLNDGDFWALTAYSDGDLHGLFPLVGWGTLAYVGPLWWTYDRKDSYELDGFGLFPLVWRDRDDDSTVVFPLWWEFGDAEQGEHSQTFFPLWHYAADGDRRRLITPLGGRGWSSDGSTRFVNVLGPIYHRSAAGDDSYTAVAWPLFTAERHAESSQTSLFPFWSHEEVTTEGRESESTELLLGAMRHAHDSEGDAWRAWPLFATTSHPDQEQWIDLFALYGHQKHGEGATLQLGTALLFQLEHQEAPQRDDTSWEAHVATFLSFGHDASPPLRADLLEEVKESAPEARLTRNHVGFLFDWFLWSATEQSSESTPSATVARHVRVPLLFEYERDLKEREWDALLWCVHETERRDEERFVAGWGLYRSVERADSVSRDVFPFMTYDRDPQRTAFSFLWRLWRYERRGDQTAGHLFFIPWGDDFEDGSL